MGASYGRGHECAIGGQTCQGPCSQGVYNPESGHWKFTSLRALVCGMRSQSDTRQLWSINVSACQWVTLARTQLLRAPRSSGRADQEGGSGEHHETGSGEARSRKINQDRFSVILVQARGQRAGQNSTCRWKTRRWARLPVLGLFHSLCKGSGILLLGGWAVLRLAPSFRSEFSFLMAAASSGLHSGELECSRLLKSWPLVQAASVDGLDYTLCSAWQVSKPTLATFFFSEKSIPERPFGCLSDHSPLLFRTSHGILRLQEQGQRSEAEYLLRTSLQLPPCPSAARNHPRNGSKASHRLNSVCLISAGRILWAALAKPGSSLAMWKEHGPSGRVNLSGALELWFCHSVASLSFDLGKWQLLIYAEKIIIVPA